MSIESVMPSSHLIFCHPLLLPSIFPSIRVFSNELALCIRWPKYWHFSFSVRPSNNIEDWFPLGLTGLISDWLVWSPCSPRDSQESFPTPQFKSINSLVFSLLYGPTFISIHYYWKNHSFDYTDLCTSIVTLIVAKIKLGFTGDSDSKESACGVEDPGLIPGSEKSPGEGKGYPLHYSCQENPKDREAWWAMSMGVTKSQTRLSN